jgi:hypothetical protein
VLIREKDSRCLKQRVIVVFTKIKPNTLKAVHTFVILYGNLPEQSITHILHRISYIEYTIMLIKANQFNNLNFFEER